MNQEDIRQIRQEYEAKYIGQFPKALNVIELAKRYGVSQQTIRDIAKGKRYKWVQ